LLTGHFYPDFPAKQEQTTVDYLATTAQALRLAVLQFTVFPLLTTFATAIMIFWYLECLGNTSHCAQAASHVRRDFLEK
jgi:hypothetical protein